MMDFVPIIYAPGMLRILKNGERGGGTGTLCCFFQQKQQSTLNILNIPQMDGEEPNKGGVKKAIPKFGCMAENSVDIDTFFFLLFLICYLLFVICFWKLSKSICCFFWLKEVWL